MLHRYSLCCRCKTIVLANESLRIDVFICAQ